MFGIEELLGILGREEEERKIGGGRDKGEEKRGGERKGKEGAGISLMKGGGRERQHLQVQP